MEIFRPHSVPRKGLTHRSVVDWITSLDALLAYSSSSTHPYLCHRSTKGRVCLPTLGIGLGDVTCSSQFDISHGR